MGIMYCFRCPSCRYRACRSFPSGTPREVLEGALCTGCDREQSGTGLVYSIDEDGLHIQSMKQDADD